MQLPTVKIREKATGRIKIINQTKYGDNLAGFTGWEIISMRRGEASDLDVAIEREQERIETIRQHNPKSPAFGDRQRAFDARSDIRITANVKAEATAENPFATDVTSAVTETEVEEETTREVPVIGGSQTVKLRGRKPKVSGDEGSVL